MLLSLLSFKLFGSLAEECVSVFTLKFFLSSWPLWEESKLEPGNYQVIVL